MRFLVRVLVIICCLGIGTVVLGNMAERWVFYPFDATRVAPLDVNLPKVTETTFTSDGETLVAWVAQPRAGKPVILYFHGNAGNLAARVGRFRVLLKRGYGLFAPAYRGSSGSTGHPVEAALMQDANAAYDAMFSQFPDLEASGVVVYGESLGAAVSIALLSTLSAPADRTSEPSAGLILEAPFTSLPDLAEYHYEGTKALAHKLDSVWPSLDRARNLTLPILILHGSQDDLIPTEMGRQILSAAPSNKKKLIVVKGGGHTDLWKPDTLARTWRFIDQLSLR